MPLDAAWAANETELFEGVIYRPQASDHDWFEYRIEKTCNECNEYLGVFDSLHETYNGVQKLTQKEAFTAMTDMLHECRDGSDDFFEVCACCKAKGG